MGFTANGKRYTDTSGLTDADITSLQVIADNTERFQHEMGNAISRALEKIGLVAEGYAKRLCPVDTGRLRNSITHTMDEDSAYIGTNVEYAPYVELGTVRTRAQPFLTPAAEDHMDTYRRILESEIGSI